MHYINTLDRTKVRKNGSLSFYNKPNARSSDPLERLNGENKVLNNCNRIIFKGFYEDDIEVAIQKMFKHQFETESDPKSSSEKEKREKEFDREIQILRPLHMHDNFIRYFCCEMDDQKEFV